MDDDDDDDTPLEDQLCRIATAAQEITDEFLLESAACFDESRRLQKESERLQQESQRMREKGDKLNKYCNELRNLQQTSLLDRFCCALRHNDPRITTLNLERLAPILPSNYVEPLGKAIEGNTHISSITLTHNRMNPQPMEWTQEKATRLVQYVQTSDSIRHMDLSIEDEIVAADFLIAIGINPSIKQLTLNSVLPPNAFCDLMGTTRSIQSLTFNVVVEEQAADVIVQAFSANQTLESLIIANPKRELSGLSPFFRELPCLKQTRCEFWT
jgi:hypothetical protein